MGKPATIRQPKPERVREALQYDAETGAFTRWMKCSHAYKQAGGYSKSTGYNYVALDGITYPAARLAWIYVNGPVPLGMIVDHVSRDRADDRISNLRLATISQNGANCSRHADGAAGLKGVHLHKESGRWRAQIMASGKRVHLGLFRTAEQAHAAYIAAARELCGPFATGGGHR